MAKRIAAVCIAVLALAGCSKSPDRQYQGWVEGDLIFVGPDEAGRLETLSVREGQRAETGTPLFALDTELHLADIETAEAAVTNAKQDSERAKKLFETSSGARTTVEDTEAAFRSARARLTAAQTRLARRKIASPGNGLVQQIYVRPGEYVSAGRAVVSLLPLDHVKVRFFVPETVLASVAIGGDVTIHCDGCRQDFPGKITFISQTAEFTPPVIFSLEERSKLVYLIEARTGTPGDLRVGQPVDVKLVGEAEVSVAPADGDIVIDVHGLTKTFDGRTVVRDLSMQVKRGRIYGFLGPNGSGKTTTIRMLCGLLTPDQGTGTCLGYDIRTQTDKIKRKVGYMTQRFSLYQDLSVRENLEFVARVFALPDPRRAARDMIMRLGLQGREEQLAGSLSGGWKQRLALGACTLPSPQLLLLDEPTAGVDPKARRDFWNEIYALAAEGLTVLVSTHYMDEAERCHEIAYIAYGVLLTHGTVEQVIAELNLRTYTVTGGDLQRLANELAEKPGVESVAPFGAVLHVSGRDAEKLEASLEPYRHLEALQLSRSEPSLEDVFIDLMARARDNFQ